MKWAKWARRPTGSKPPELAAQFDACSKISLHRAGAEEPGTGEADECRLADGARGSYARAEMDAMTDSVEATTVATPGAPPHLVPMCSSIWRAVKRPSLVLTS